MINTPKSFRPDVFIFATALFIVVSINVIGIHRPPFDNHNFRQCQTLSTIEFFYEQGVDLLHPQTNYKGEPGVFVLELPLFQALSALLLHISGGSLIAIRIFNIIITLVSGGMTWLISRKLFGADAAAPASLIYLTGTLNLIYM